ncbi:MAG: nitrite/sulfite reductase [Thalassobaculales bacterium]
MYQYTEFDRGFLRERVAQFRDQVNRRLSGALTEDAFKPLRLMNGLYHQLHAYMLRIAIPYGTLNSAQLRKLADVARRFDRGWGHFTTRQNLQLNWIKLEEAPDVLAALAEADLHGLQTSGNCIRNVTADHLAGVAPDEIEDPRSWAEIIRQWSTLHPEFSFLPRKFKIAVTGAPTDRAAVKVHDIGLRMHRNAGGEVGFEVIVGGGLGRTPMIGKTVRDWVAKEDLLSYLEAVLRVYNLYGRRDNIYKARIKILVHEIGVERLRADVEAEFARIRDGALKLPAATIAAIQAQFAPPPYEALLPDPPALLAARLDMPAFDRWVRANVEPHRQPGYAAVTVSLKPVGGSPGDATSEQMEVVANLADRFSFGEIRVTHVQNLLLPHVAQRDLPALWRVLEAAGLATANRGLATDIIACPGLDYCSLANARSIPVAQRLSARLAPKAELLGPLQIKISGCINACGHHHVGHIGILGVDKNGEEFYQVTVGGNATENAAIGTIIGPAVAADRLVESVEALVDAYLALRRPGESFVEAYARVGQVPFKEVFRAAA